MQRTTIMLPRDLKIKANKLASKIGVSLSELIRESLELRCTKKAVMNNDPFFEDNSICEGKIPANISVHHDGYLY